MMNCLVCLIIFMPMAAAFLSYLIGRRSKRVRDGLVGVVTILEFVLSLLLLLSLSKMDGEIVELPGVCGFGLTFTVDGFRAIYGVIASFMWMMTSLFSPEYFRHYRNRNRYYLFQLVTLGATEAVFLSADLYTTFIFFEIMSLASYVWVVQDEKEEAMRAGATYLAVAVISAFAGTAPLGMLNSALIGFVGCLVYERGDLTASAAMQAAWMFWTNHLFAWPDSGYANVYRMFEVSEGWLTGGSAGAEAGIGCTILWMIIAAYLLLKERNANA